MVQDFAKKGFFPEALANFVALCGWNPGTDTEFFSMTELIEAFSLERVNKAGAVFDYQKLHWMNGEYLKTRAPEVLAEELLPTLVTRGFEYVQPAFVASVIALVRERVHFLQDVTDFADYLFGDVLSPLSEEAAATITGNEALITAVQTFRSGLNDETIENLDAFKELSKNSAESAGMKVGAFMKPLRLVLTHREVGADLFGTIKLLGVQRCGFRLDAFFSS